MGASAESQWPIPDGLSADGQTAALAIRGFLTDKTLLEHGGGGRFYTPEQWAERGESYGTKSLLVITHDGGDHAPAFNLDYGQYKLHDQLQEHLSPLGLYVEACTSWYTAIYRQ